MVQGGGVFVLVSSLYESEEPEELKVVQDCELVWAKVKVQGSKDLYVGSFYKPPKIHGNEYLETLNSYLARIPTHNGAHLWIGGDFNLADIDWETECIKPYPTNGTQCEQLLTIAKDTFLEQVVKEPTRVTEDSSNILDLFFTNNETLVNQVHVIPGIADHEAVFIESSLRPQKKTTAPRKIFQYRKADYDGFRAELRDYTSEFLSKAPSSDINSLWKDFKGKIHQLMEKFIPQKLFRGDKTRKPWIDKHVKALQRKRNKLFKKQRASHRTNDISHYKQIRARVQKAERQAYWKHVENIIDIGDPESDYRPNKQKRFWSFIKSLRKDSSGVSPLKENGKMHADPKDKTNILNRQYESVYTKEDTSHVPSPSGRPYQSMEGITVTKQGVRKLLQKINPRKACGPDMIPARILKDLPEEVAPLLTCIFQRSFDCGEVPADWRSAIITPEFKKGADSKQATTVQYH